MAKGQWSRWGRGMCEGYGLTLGEVYRSTVTRRDNGIGGPAYFEASLNVRTFADKYPNKESAMLAVEHEIEMGMKTLQEDWAVFQATKFLALKKKKLV